jgi:hypothetical protein
LLEQGRIPEAKQMFRAVLLIVGTRDPGRQAVSKLEEMLRAGLGKLDEADRYYEEHRYDEAIKLVEEVRTDYGNVFGSVRGAHGYANLAQKAAATLARWKKDPRTAPAFQERLAVHLWERVEILADLAKDTPTRYYDLYQALQVIIRRYPDCPTGQKSAAMLRDLETDKKIHAIIIREGQRRVIVAALQRAEDARRAGLADEAAGELAKLAELFPGKSLDELRRMARESS